MEGNDGVVGSDFLDWHCLFAAFASLDRLKLARSEDISSAVGTAPPGLFSNQSRLADAAAITES